MAISYSETQCFKTCRKMHEWQYIKGIRPKDKAEALFFGSAIHSALEMLYKDMPLEAALSALDELDDVNRAKGRALIKKYHEKYMTMPVDVVAVENWVRHQFGNQEFVGRIDAIIEQDGRRWIVEHKTATSVDDAYMERVKIDTQSMLYVLAAEEEFGDIEGVIYDILIKPAIRLKKSESVEEFEARCMADVDGENFVRVLQRFSPKDLSEAIADFIVCSCEINGCKQGTLTAYRNTGACNAIGRACPYLCLCCEKKPDKLADLIAAKFTVKEGST